MVGQKRLQGARSKVLPWAPVSARVALFLLTGMRIQCLSWTVTGRRLAGVGALGMYACLTEGETWKGGEVEENGSIYQITNLLKISLLENQFP